MRTCARVEADTWLHTRFNFVASNHSGTPPSCPDCMHCRNTTYLSIYGADVQ